MATGITTYCSAFSIKCLSNVTKGDMVNMANDINARFRVLYQVPVVVTFAHNPEGGFVLSTNEVDFGYKSIRFNESHCDHRDVISFPKIPENVMETWNNSEDVALYENQKRIMWLKAFNNAPKWTQTELSIFRECFSNYGIKCSRTRITIN